MVGLRVEHLVRIIREDETWLTLPRDEARELYDALHAEFGDFDQARELAQLARESVARELRLAELEAEVLALRRAADPISVLEEHDGPMSDSETGPSLQDDIEAMKAKADPWSDPNTVTNPAYWDCNCEDDYIHSKLESFCQRCNANREDQPDSRVREVDDAFPRSVGLAPSNTPEPPAEPEPAPEASVLANDRLTAQKSPRTRETDSERAVRLWHSYRAKRPDELPNSAVGRVKSHLKHLSTPQIRELLRASGIDIPDPQSQAEAAAKARYAQAAKRQAEAKRAKVAPLDGSGDVLPAVMAAASPSVISTHEGVRYDPLLDRFPEPPANLDVLDALALTWEILEESRPQISSFITTRVGLAATMAYKAAVEAMKPEYEAMAPFARREFKSAIAARWHKERAA